MAKSDINERPEVGGDGGAQRVVTQAETETFVWLPINNIPRRSPKQATGMKYLLAKCNNWQWEQKSARSLALAASPWKTFGPDGQAEAFLTESSLSFSDIFYFILGFGRSSFKTNQT